MKFRALILSIALCVCFALQDSPELFAAESTNPVIEASGVQGGLVVQLGCDDGRATASLCANDRYIVQGLDTDVDKVAAARGYLYEAGLSGSVTAERYDGKTLPYADNLVKLLVVAAKCEVPEAELMRVLTPGGVLMQKQGDRWQRTVKAWPVDIDQWTHHLHGPDNNPVAQDTTIGPPRRLQWQSPSLWSRSHEHISSFAAMVSANGRTFYIFDDSVPGVTEGVPAKWTLYARDAFSGVLLWKKVLENWDSPITNPKALRSTSATVQRSLVAEGDLLYTTDGHRGPLLVLDGATGTPVRTINGTEGVDEIICEGGMLYLRIRSDEYSGIIKADPKTGTILWRYDEKLYLPMSMAVSRGKLVYSNRKELVGLDSKAGQKLWSNDSAELKSQSWSSGPTILIADGHVLVGPSPALLCISLDTGEAEWKAPRAGGGLRGVDLFVIKGAVWCGAQNGVVGYDLETGKVVKQVDARSVFSPGHHHRCYRAKATSNYILAQFRGVEFLSIESDEKHCQNDWTRGPCRYGVMPSGGLLYVPQHQCFCYPGSMMNGLNAYASATEAEMKAISDAAENLNDRLELGPGLAKLGSRNAAKESTATDWPMYRKSPNRHGSTSAHISGELSRSWKTKLGGRLTPPVMADGAVYVADKDSNTLYALDLATGKERWHFITGGQIDSPPVVLDGGVCFGSADGWAYCVLAENGTLVWRRRLAPTSRKIVVNNRVESPWRVHGSPLLHDGRLYFSAGRSSFLDGGIFLYALDPKSGSVIHQGRIDTWTRTRQDTEGKPFLPAFHIEGTRSDLLVAEGDYLYMGQVAMTGELKIVDSPYRPGPETFKEDRGGPDAFGPIVKGRPVEENATYDFVEKDVVASYPKQSMRWYRRGHMGARNVGRHLITTGGFLDDTYWHRIFWMYGETWPGFYITNVASKTGQLLVVGPQKTYAVQCYPRRVVLSPMFTPEQRGYLLFADDNENEPVLDDRDWGRDKGMGFSRTREPLWHHWIPLRIRAMTLADDRLFVAGPADLVDPADPLATFEDRTEAVLWSCEEATGKKTTEHNLEATPVFDGMIATPGRLLISLSDGSVVCMEGKN